MSPAAADATPKSALPTPVPVRAETAAPAPRPTDTPDKRCDARQRRTKPAFHPTQRRPMTAAPNTEPRTAAWAPQPTTPAPPLAGPGVQRSALAQSGQNWPE